MVLELSDQDRGKDTNQQTKVHPSRLSALGRHCHFLGLGLSQNDTVIKSPFWLVLSPRVLLPVYGEENTILPCSVQHPPQVIYVSSPPSVCHWNENSLRGVSLRGT